MSTCAELAVLLAEARAAAHKIAIGGGLIGIRIGEKERRYSPGNVGVLNAYIRELQAQVDACNGVPRAGRAIHFMPVDC
jgi:gpW